MSWQKNNGFTIVVDTPTTAKAGASWFSCL